MDFPKLDDKQKQSSNQHPGSPDPVVLILLWFYAATLGLFFGYLPPRFKPQWLYNLVLASIFVVWIGLGLAQLMFRVVWSEGPGDVILGVIAILVGIGGLVFVILQVEPDAKQD